MVKYKLILILFLLIMLTGCGLLYGNGETNYQTLFGPNNEIKLSEKSDYNKATELFDNFGKKFNNNEIKKCTITSDFKLKIRSEETTEEENSKSFLKLKNSLNVDEIKLQTGVIITDSFDSIAEKYNERYIKDGYLYRHYYDYGYGEVKVKEKILYYNFDLWLSFINECFPLGPYLSFASLLENSGVECGYYDDEYFIIQTSEIIDEDVNNELRIVFKKHLLIYMYYEESYEVNNKEYFKIYEIKVDYGKVKFDFPNDLDTYFEKT